MLLFSSERAWAHGMHLKSLISEDPTSASSSMKNHAVSRLHKAQKHAFELSQLLSTAESGASDNDLLEATAYACSHKGSEAFEKQHWEDALRSFAVSRTIYSALSTVLKSDIFKEQLTTTVDPSVRYSAYQLQLPRSLDIASITQKYFPRDAFPKVVEGLEKVDPQAFPDQMDVGTAGSGAVTSVTWRGRTAPVEEADISVALFDAQTAEAAYNSQDQHSSTDAFDAVLLAWQDAVDATRKAIDERQAEGMSMAEQKMQHLQLTWTVVNYSMICWRVGRNRVMISNIMAGPKGAKKDGKEVDEEVRSKRLGHLKEEIALHDAILQVCWHYVVPTCEIDATPESRPNRQPPWSSGGRPLFRRTHRQVLFLPGPSHLLHRPLPRTPRQPQKRSCPLSSRAPIHLLRYAISSYSALGSVP
jgi:signal recognition particle subunit SRP68